MVNAQAVGAVIENVVAQVHPHDFADDDAMGMGRRAHIHHLHQAAFHIDRRFGHARRLDDGAGGFRKAGNLKLGDIRRVLGGGGVHSGGDVVHHHIDHIFPGFLNVGEGVLALVRPAGGAAGRGKHQGRRVVGHGVEKAVRRQVHHPVGGHRGHESDGARHHHAGEDHIEAVEGFGVNEHWGDTSRR